MKDQNNNVQLGIRATKVNFSTKRLQFTKPIIEPISYGLTPPLTAYSATWNADGSTVAINTDLGIVAVTVIKLEEKQYAVPYKASLLFDLPLDQLLTINYLLTHKDTPYTALPDSIRQELKKLPHALKKLFVPEDILLEEEAQEILEELTKQSQHQK